MELIDKVELINSLKLLAKFEDTTRASVILGIIETVKKQKTVDAVPVVGHWIKNDDHEGWHCSVCKKDDVYAYSCDFDNKLELQDLYCPNCGANMDGKVEDGID